MLKTNIDEVLHRGWSILEINPGSELLEISRALGEPMASRINGPLVDILRVVEAENARERSLSAKYGTGAFPWHTDLAHIRIPPRFVLMRSLGAAGARPSLLFDTNGLCRSPYEDASLRTDIWLVNGGRGRFLTPIINDTLLRETRIFRYDPCVMRPMQQTSPSAALIKRLNHSRATAVIQWAPGLCVIIDNWRMAHARAPQPGKPEPERMMERVLIRV